MSKNLDKVTFLYMALVGMCHSLFFARDFDGELTPQDPYLCTGQDFTFTCKLLSEPSVNNSIGFAVKNQNTGGSRVPVDEAKVTRFNETVAQYTVYNISMGFMHITCYYWRVYGQMERNLQLGTTSTSYIYPSPQAVKDTDFQCIVTNYKSMTCSWDFGKDYGQKLPEIVFRWRQPSSDLAWNDCPSNDSVKSGYCTWDSIRDGAFEDANITIRLTLKQPCGMTESSEFRIDTSKRVKPNPVLDLTALPINSTCINLTWSSSDSLPHHQKEHRIIVYMKDEVLGDKTQTFTTKDVSNHSITVCDLRPYTEYKFSVSMQPTGYFSGYFSDERESVAETFPDIPSASPVLTEGGYRWKWRDCQAGKQRRVCVFWKDIADDAKNGPMRGIVGTFTPRNSSERTVNENWAEDATYGCTVISCTSSYVFQIQARNVIGTSNKSSTIEIDSVLPAEVRPRVLVESSNRSDVYVTWSYPQTSSTQGFTVVWCRNKNGDCNGTDTVNWKENPADTREAVIQIHAPNSAQDFLYGVSVQNDHVSFGLDWEECVHLKHARPRREPQNVIVTEGPGDNTLLVTWDKLTCKSDEPYIEKYNIQYRKRTGNMKYVNVTSLTEARLVLKGLEGGQSYEVAVRGVTEDGQYGPESEPQIGTPVDRRLKPSAIAGITMGVLVCAIFAGLGCFCVIRRCKMRAKMAIKEAGNIKIPDGGDFHPIKEFWRQESIDSGHEESVFTTSSEDAITIGDSVSINSRDYHFVTDWRKSKKSITTGLYELNTLFARPIAEKTNLKNVRESAKRLLGSFEKSRCILEIPKPSSFRNMSTRDTTSEESDKNRKNSRCGDYVSTEEVAAMKPDEQSKDEVTGQPDMCDASDQTFQIYVDAAGKSITNQYKYLEAEPTCSETSFHINEQNDIVLRETYVSMDASRLLAHIPTPQAVTTSLNEQTDIISREIQKPLDVSQLLTHIPTPRDGTISMRSDSNQLNDITDREPDTVVSVLSKADSTHPKYPSDYITTCNPCTKPSLSPPTPSNITDISSVPSSTDIRQSNRVIMQRDSLNASPVLFSLADANEKDPGNIKSEVPICSNLIQQNYIPVLQMQGLLNSTATADQNNITFQSIAQENFTPSQYVTSSNLVQTCIEQGSSSKFHLYSGENQKNPVFTGEICEPSSGISSGNLQTAAIVNDSTDSSTERQNIVAQVTSAYGNVVDFPLDTAEAQTECRAFGSYVPLFVVETSDDKVGRSKVPPVESQSTVHPKCPANGPFVPVNVKSDIVIDTIPERGNAQSPGYVDSTLANIPPIYDNANAEDKNTCNSLKAVTDGYVDQSVLEILQP